MSSFSAAREWRTWQPISASTIGVPVADGVAAATTTVQSLVSMGLRTSTRSEFARPLPKQMVGLLAGFTVGEPGAVNGRRAAGAGVDGAGIGS